MTRLTVHLSDAVTDVLVHLVDSDQPQHLPQIVRAVAPTDADRPIGTVSGALGTLRDLGYAAATTTTVLGFGWSATDEGRAAVAAARAVAEGDRAGES